MSEPHIVFAPPPAGTPASFPPTPPPPTRTGFRAGWIPLGHAAVLLVLWDHRRTLRALGIPSRALATRLFAVIADGAR